MTKQLTRDEEADLIIKKLKKLPKSKEEVAMERMCAALCAETQEMIDNEILQELTKIAKGIK